MASTVEDCALCYGLLTRTRVVQHDVRRLRGGLLTAMLDTAQRTDPGAVRDGRRALRAWRALARTDPPVDLIVSPTLGVREIPYSDVDELAIRVPFSAYT